MPQTENRNNGRRRRRSIAAKEPTTIQPSTRGWTGGRYLPLNPEDLPKIDAAARSILTDIGMIEAPKIVIDHVIQGGGRVDEHGRLRFSGELIENALQGLTREFTLCGQDPAHDLQLGHSQVHVGSGGAAPMVIDINTGHYRESTLCDLYDAARLVDCLDNIHFFSRPMVARDIPDTKTMDVNTVYACLAGTRKHVFASASQAEQVEDIAQICYMVAGSREAFEARPFLSINCNLPVPPLRFDAESCEVAAAVVKAGIPLHSNTFGQMGASSPVTMAGTIAQTIAETLSGMIFAWLVNPDAKVIFGTRPMLTDLRTGAMSGGSPEGAIATAATAQMGNYYGLVNSTIAGASDSKIADAQSGYEKGIAITLAAQAGSNLITQASGMQASLMGCALESYVIDNDMLGVIMKSLSRIEVSDETLALDAIDEVAHGEGHFLGRAETLERMQSDFVYPEMADRRTIGEWEADGSLDIRSVAIERTRQILSSHHPSHFSDKLDQSLREKFDIRLPKLSMGVA
ncbi:MAG: trimethylamine methyltransferase [Gammaproteobacteria bacterium]|nr:trimethylamine methyltransferase [Gammaproteobacteria bacterium]